MSQITLKSSAPCFGGTQAFYTHLSQSTGTEMRFGVYLPPAAAQGSVPALYYLAGLTCTEETFLIKAGAQRVAADLGLALIACDTSPRGLNLPGDSEAWDFGVGAGFYVDATQLPWAPHYRMGHYVNDELPALIESHFAVRSDKRGIFGHSMGGHGALVAALRNPTRWNSVSAFAPICNPMNVPWGKKAFANYLGDDERTWAAWDACMLMSASPHPANILVDQGLSDQFLERELRPNALREAARESGQQLTLREHAGYDHSYWFIQTFIEDHLRHHASILTM